MVWVNARGLDIREASLDTGGGPRSVGRSPATTTWWGSPSIGRSSRAGPAPGGLRRPRVPPGDHRGLRHAGRRATGTCSPSSSPSPPGSAFPCFDEPACKVPWRLTLRVPRDLVALSNAPIACERADGRRPDAPSCASPRPGPCPATSSRSRSARSTSSTSVASAATGRPIRLVAAERASRRHRLRRASTPTILALLEDYFDRPYPYAKLDQVAIPGVGFAMEHPGPGHLRASASWSAHAEDHDRAPAATWRACCAHELAHQWFGRPGDHGLVGRHLAQRGVRDAGSRHACSTRLQARVGYGAPSEAVDSQFYALRVGQPDDARRIRQPIETRHDIDGERVRRASPTRRARQCCEMIESWLGGDLPPWRSTAPTFGQARVRTPPPPDDLVGALSLAGGARARVPPSPASSTRWACPLVTARARVRRGRAAVSLEWGSASSVRSASPVPAGGSELAGAGVRVVPG